MKAILVIDMPLSCHDCPLMSGYVCLADERVGNVYEWSRCRYPLCPLEEMPKKREVENAYTNYGEEPWFSDGWNACVEYLEGDGDGS